MYNEPKKILMSSVFIFTMLVLPKILDLATTYVGISTGVAYESNPFSAILLSEGGWFMLCFVSLFIATVTSFFFIVWQYYITIFPSVNILLLVCRGGVILISATSLIPVANNLLIIFLGF